MNLQQPNNDKNKVVELSELVSQPECLKLLILHTPFTLSLQALPLCINLVKLDLSRNNLAAFPYLGQLINLRFIYIHENKLDVKAMINIFQQDIESQSKSPLSKVVIWVTYWGNKNQFQARHYLANHTSVLAVDGYMIAPEQRNQSIIVNKMTTLPFSEQTNVSSILQNRRKFNKNATQDEYMKQFWDDIYELRRKQEQINPIIKIQKVFRGWSYRNQMQKRKKYQQRSSQLLTKSFFGWVRQHRYEKKLKKMLVKKKKQYLLLPLKEMSFQIQKNKILKYARQAKSRVLLRKSLSSCEYKLYDTLKAHTKLLKSFYSSLCIQGCSAIYVHFQNLKGFEEYVIPFVHRMNPGVNLKIEKNHNVLLRSLYVDQKSKKQFLRILTVNERTVSYMRRLRPLEKLNQKNSQVLPKLFQSILKCNNIMKKLYSFKNVHFSNKQKEKMKKIDEDFCSNRQKNLSELIQIIQTPRVLRDIVRGIFFYNLGHFHEGKRPKGKIDLLSQYFIRKISSVITIQRIWKGYSLRKKMKRQAIQSYTRHRAVVKIQRWVRNLRWKHRSDFIFEQGRYLKLFGNNYFYIRLNDYLKVVQKGNNYDEQKAMTFHQQHICAYIDQQSKELLISWKPQPDNEAAYICRNKNKNLLNENFNKKVFDNWRIPVPNFSKDAQKYSEVDISHIFHYQTETAIITRKSGKYLQIKCLSKYDCRMRALAILLIGYRFNRKSSNAVFPKQYLNFNQIETQLRNPVANRSAMFMFEKQSSHRIQATALYSSKFDVSTKFYLNPDPNKKPIRYSSDLTIIIVKNQGQTPKKAHIAARSQSFHHNYTFDVENFLIADTKDIKLDQQTRNKKLEEENYIKNHYQKKKSFKKFKLQKKLKMKSGKKGNFQPDFLLDNSKAMVERLTTQPQLTHQRSLGSVNFQKDRSINKSVKQKNPSLKYNYVSESSAKKRILKTKIAEQRHSSKNLDDFTKNFINQGNFLQNQYMSGHYKRIRTQIEKQSLQKVDRLKSQESQWSQNIKKRKEDKKKYARELAQEHKDLVMKSNIDKMQQQQRKKIIRTENSEPKNRRSYKRVKVTFAEQCYPIIGRKPQDHSLE